MTGSFRFGISLREPLQSRTEFVSAVERIEELGFDFLGAADHLGHVAPFSALIAAAVHTERLRLRTYVLNVAFWNPALLAREAASADVLSDGRLELGLGAGHMRSEWDHAGLTWEPAAARVARLSATAALVHRRLGEKDMRPTPVQCPVPLLIGAMARRPERRRAVRRHRRLRRAAPGARSPVGHLCHRHSGGDRRARRARARAARRAPV